MRKEEHGQGNKSPAGRRWEPDGSNSPVLSSACARKALLESLQSPFASPTPLNDAASIEAQWDKLSHSYFETDSTDEELEATAFQMVHLAETSMSIDDDRRFTAYSEFAARLLESDDYSDAQIVLERLLQYCERFEEIAGEVHDGLINALLDLHRCHSELGNKNESEIVLTKILDALPRAHAESQGYAEVTLELLTAVEDVATAARNLELSPLVARAKTTAFMLAGFPEMSAREALQSISDEANRLPCLGAFWGTLAKGANAGDPNGPYLALLARQQKSLANFLRSLDSYGNPNPYESRIPRAQEDLMCCSLARVEAWLDRENVIKAMKSFKYAARFVDLFEEGDAAVMFDLAERISRLLEESGNTPGAVLFMRSAKAVWLDCPSLEGTVQLEWAMATTEMARRAEMPSTNLEVSQEAFHLFHLMRAEGTVIPPAQELRVHYQVGRALVASAKRGANLDAAREHFYLAVSILTDINIAAEMKALPDYDTLLISSHLHLGTLEPGEKTRDYHLNECVAAVYAIKKKGESSFQLALDVGRVLFRHKKYDEVLELCGDALSSTVSNDEVPANMRIRMLQKCAKSAWKRVENLPPNSTEIRIDKAERKVIRFCEEGLALIRERNESPGQMKAQRQLLRLKANILERHGDSDELDDVRNDITVLSQRIDQGEQH